MLDLYKPHKILPKNLDFEKLFPNFGWLPAETVKIPSKIQPNGTRLKIGS